MVLILIFINFKVTIVMLKVHYSDIFFIDILTKYHYSDIINTY